MSNLIKNQRGVNLVEVVICMTLLAVSIPPIFQFFSQSLTEDGHTDQYYQASFLAQSLMNEISERRFREDGANPGNGVDTGEVSAFSRVSFDDIDDYDIFTATWGPQSPPRNESGAQLTNYPAFSQSVTVTNISPPTAGPTARVDYSDQGDGTTDFKLVHVRIAWDNDERETNLYKVFALD